MTLYVILGLMVLLAVLSWLDHRRHGTRRKRDENVFGDDVGGYEVELGYGHGHHGSHGGDGDDAD